MVTPVFLIEHVWWSKWHQEKDAYTGLMPKKWCGDKTSKQFLRLVGPLNRQEALLRFHLWRPALEPGETQYLLSSLLLRNEQEWKTINGFGSESWKGAMKRGWKERQRINQCLTDVKNWGRCWFQLKIILGNKTPWRAICLYLSYLTTVRAPGAGAVDAAGRRSDSGSHIVAQTWRGFFLRPDVGWKPTLWRKTNKSQLDFIARLWALLVRSAQPTGAVGAEGCLWKIKSSSQGDQSWRNSHRSLASYLCKMHVAGIMRTRVGKQVSSVCILMA